MPSWYRDPEAPVPNRPMRVGAVALIERDATLLVERRADDGTWGLVAGALENDESIVEAFVREIEEALELRFTAHDELLGLDLTPAHRPIVERYLAGSSHVIVE